MDLASLAVVLRAALSPDPGERKAAEERLEQLQYTPQHLVRLLRIIVDSEFDMAVRQAASIHFKNFVARNWSPDDPGQLQKILSSDKDTVRENILAYMPQVPSLLRSQLGECLKSIILANYPDQWPGLLLWIQSNLQQDQQIYGALYVLRILSRKYEFRSDEERVPIYQIVGETFPQLLSIYGKLVQITNPALEVSDLIKLICKIFWSSIYLEIPKQLFEINVFTAWMALLLNMLERPVPLGQPTDPDLRNSWGWWKVKKWIIQILNRLYTRFSDTQIQKPENKAFAQMFHKNYAGKILECYLTLLNAIRVGAYLPDRVTNLILQYLSCSISKNSMYDLLAPHLDIILFEIIFPLICFNNNDQMLWDEDPHEYVRKGYDVIEDIYSPRTAAMDFVNEFVRKRGKENLQKVVQFIVVIFNRYLEEPMDVKSYHQKDGALLAVGALCDKLKQTDPYKSELESMLVQHVFPEFKSHVGHLRAKAAWVSGQYAGIAFSDPKNFRTALHYVISGLHDSDLPVRVDSLFALRPFIEACQDLNEIRPYVPQLLDEFFKLMKEVENEDLVVTLEAIVDRFGEEMAPFAIGLCQNLTAAFWRCLGSSEAEDDDSGALAAVGCLRAIGAILGSVNRLPRLFIEIEPIVLPIMKKMLTTDGQDVFEEVLEIISYMTFYSPTISLEMWSLWPLLMEALDNWALDYFENILIPLDNYISRGTAHFLSCKDPDYQLSLWNMLSSIMSDKNMEDSDIKPAPKLIEVVLQNCKGQVDNWIKPYLRITISRLQRAEKAYLKCLLIEVIANALYYNASLTLSIMQKLGVATAVFVLWFRMLQEVKKSGACANFRREHDKKVCCLGLTSLLLLPSVQLPDQALDRVFRVTLALLISYKDQIAEATKEDDNSYHDMDGLRSDADENNEDEDDMGVDAEDGDEASNLKLQKLASKARAFYPDHDDESDDDYSDDEEFQSPIDEVDPFVFFVDAMKVIQASDPARFQTLMRSLDPQSQSLTNNIVQRAEMRRAELEKDKQEKATSL